jgi:hypothetical protein
MMTTMMVVVMTTAGYNTRRFNTGTQRPAIEATSVQLRNSSCFIMHSFTGQI